MMQPHGYGPPMGFVQPMATSARALGNQLEVPRGAHLPPICAKCGTPHGVAGHMMQFVYVPPVAYVGLVAGVLVGAILIQAMQKKATVMVPLCPGCHQKWKGAKLARGLAIGAPFIVLVLSFVLGIALSPGDAAGAVIGIGFLLFFVGIIAAPILVHYLKIKPNTLVPHTADDLRMTFVGACPALLAEVQRLGQQPVIPHFALPGQPLPHAPPQQGPYGRW